MKKTTLRRIKAVAAKARPAPLEMSPREFRSAGHRLVEDIAKFLDSIAKRPVTRSGTARDIRARLGGGIGKWLRRQSDVPTAMTQGSTSSGIAEIRAIWCESLSPS